MPLPSRIRQWWPQIHEAAAMTGVDAYVIAAIMDRESMGGYALTPVGPSGTGDHGHGLGLLQIDSRYHQDFAIRTLPDGRNAWEDAQLNVLYGANILATLLKRFERYERAQLPAAIAGYNADPVRVEAALDHLTYPCSYEAQVEACDTVTTHCDYVSDVLGRIDRFKAPAPPPASPPPPPPESA